MSITICIGINITSFHRDAKKNATLTRRIHSSFSTDKFSFVFVISIIISEINRICRWLKHNKQTCRSIAINIRILHKLYDVKKYSREKEKKSSFIFGEKKNNDHFHRVNLNLKSTLRAVLFFTSFDCSLLNWRNTEVQIKRI